VGTSLRLKIAPLGRKMLSTILWILVGAAATGAPALLVKEYLKDTRATWLLLACALSYAVLVTSYLNLFATGSVHVLYPIIKVVSIVLVVAGGVVLFRERIGWKGIAGGVSAAVAIYLLSTD
jgi:drug/metabolite transporter (DMT)-like permease